MTIRVALEHRTTYSFAEPVEVFPHTVRLRPAPHSRTPIAAYSLNVSPRNHFINWQQDPFGNYLARLVFLEPVRELDIVVDVVADMTVINPFDFFLEPYAERYPFTYPDALKADLEPYLRAVDESGDGGPGPLVSQWVQRQVTEPYASLTGDDRPRMVDFLVAINTAMQNDIAYTVRMAPGVQTPDTTLTNALGSCRDSAWLLVSVLREAGLAARFVSGYLVQLTSDVDALEGPSGPKEDFTDLHAWAEVFVPGAGWIGLDPTSGLFAGEGHIPLSATPHPSSAAPITGSTAPVAVTMSFANTVRRVHEDPRVTRPYSEQQWEAVDVLGGRVDELLAAGDVRLTMGGEPTFVSTDDTATPQWESAADGPEKRALAQKLSARLERRWASGGVVHHGQGKWYPGEDLPRWNIAITWRTDGLPIWEDRALLANPWDKPTLETGSMTALTAARDLAVYIAGGLGISGPHVVPAYDDPLVDFAAEAQQPVGDQRPDDLEPDDPALADPQGRSAKLAVIDAGHGSPRGWVVPMFRLSDDGRWGTTNWRTRRRHLFLTPGTSPMGLRLPLSSLAWAEGPDEVERSPFEMTGLLPIIVEGEAPPAVVLDIEDAPRHALCVEEREGHLYVFLPPLSKLEDALELLSVVETAASAIELPVVLEGYPLPFDLRTKTLSVTPDPGVIEVNTQPTSSWAEQRDLTVSLYEDARQTRLATEKFDLDGTHTGTGGGNHFTLGGATPADSPLLRRPDLLRSLITYWQHHPALSYVFSGRFIGPTSQAPRVDEGRHETLYELEIAFAELDRVGADASAFAPPDSDLPALPWNTDRLLRHLLTDLTGNTHRSEFCIDKLYSPDTQRGRLGLLELRGFEMPPHPRMALVQALLVRTLVAMFWERPYRGPLVRWGTRLHDRFLLPAFAAADLREVVADVNGWLETAEPGAHFDPAWLDPFLEFRFPRLGETRVDGVHLELRQAIEPWHVLGEEASSTGTARYVDSSVERVQLAVSGLTEGRHLITCNGVPIPLTPVENGGWGTALGSDDAPAATGMFLGGIRYRAWAPWSALHPTMGVHSPLVFDLIDTWNCRSVGGFTYHVVHPGGRSYDTYPVNAVEAESRRAARFSEQGHTPGPIDGSSWPAAERVFAPMGTEYPCTVDLRRYSPGHLG